MKWRYLGSLQEARRSGCSGVYLIVHKGVYNRVVYVGVSINVGRRISEHYEGYSRGNRTIYNVDTSEDVYSFMSAYLINDHIKEYKRLALSKKIWASTTISLLEPENLLSKEQKFKGEWEQVLVEKYMPRLCVWALPMSNYTYEKAIVIESIIQSRLIKNFDLRGFFNLRSISILGKIEHTKVYKVPIFFESLPNVDNASQIVIDNIKNTKTPEIAVSLAKEQLSEVIATRELASQRRIEDKSLQILKYRNYGQRWTVEDMEKLRVMLVNFNMESTQISKYLARSPRAIEKIIDTNDKVSNNKWRDSLEFL